MDIKLFMYVLDTTIGRVCTCDNNNCLPSEEKIEAVTNSIDELDALYNEIKVVPTNDQQYRLEILIKKTENVLGEANISLVQCLEVTMDGCLELENWDKALEYGKKLEKPYQLYLSEFNPTIGLHCFKQGNRLCFIFILMDDFSNLF